jgi:hypothetical protein
MDKVFPQYRKLINEKSYYKIHSPNKMTEFNMLGKNWLRHDLEARILPERLLIADLLDGYNGSYVIINREEFEAITGFLT